MTTTAERTATTMIALSIDLDERYPRPTLDDLMADDRMIVDLWIDDEPHVFVIGEDCTVECDDRLTLEQVTRQLEHGLRWGREPEVPAGVHVHRHDERQDFLYPATSVLPADRRERFTTWALIDETLINREEA